MKQTIFLIDDDITFSEQALGDLGSQDYVVRAFLGTWRVLERVEGERPSLIIFNVGAFGGEGRQCYRGLREHPALAGVPIVLLNVGFSDTMAELELDADGYINKPIGSRELILRVKGFLGFSGRFSPAIIRIGRLEINSDCMTVSVRGKRVSLTATEFRILEHLARHPGRAFARKELLRILRPDGRFVTPRSVDSHIWRLREKVELAPRSPVYVQTIHGRGYCLAIPEDIVRSNEV